MSSAGRRRTAIFSTTQNTRARAVADSLSNRSILQEGKDVLRMYLNFYEKNK